MGAPAASSVFAVELLAELIRRGVRDVVVCPGSRSQALALAAAAAEAAAAIRLHVRIDERSAGFFALGIARETGEAAPVIVTSGTAVANLAPAAWEAHESRVPFIALTADRPDTLRGIRSNQTTRQTGAFGRAARLSLDVPAPEPEAQGGQAHVAAESPGRLAELALGAAHGRVSWSPGPVQLNLAFQEPLSGTQGFDRMIGAGFEAAAAERDEPEEGPADESPHIPSGAYEHDGDALAVVIAGEGAGDDAEGFAHAAGLPLLAEVVSGSRFGREAIATYTTLLDEPRVDGQSLGSLIERAIVFGHPSLTRQIPALLRRADLDVIVVDEFAARASTRTGSTAAQQPEYYDPARAARLVPAASVAPGYDPARMKRWLGEWVVADRELLAARSTVHTPDTDAATATGYRERNAYARSEVAVMREPVTRSMLAESVWRATWPHDRLVVASSRLVRVLDGIAPARKVTVHANRGLAGIDGTLATALGVAVASQAGEDPARAAGTTRVLIGDLAFLHDAGSLLLPEEEQRPRIQVFVGNDHGGTIFDDLEVAGSADAAAFERVMRTPQRADLQSLAAAYGWKYRSAATRSELERLLTEPVAGPEIVEVPLIAQSASA